MQRQLLTCVTVCAWTAWLATSAAVESGPSTAEESSPAVATSGGYWQAEEMAASAWSDGSNSVVNQTPTPVVGESFLFDSEVEPIQMQTPNFQSSTARQPLRMATTRRPIARTATGAGIASIPFMIGDTGAGTCMGFSGVLDVGLAHPTLACSRLNVAEANSPLPTDRVYYSYRHFEMRRR